MLVVLKYLTVQMFHLILLFYASVSNLKLLTLYFNLYLVLNTVKLNILPYSLVVKHMSVISTKFT